MTLMCTFTSFHICYNCVCYIYFQADIIYIIILVTSTRLRNYIFYMHAAVLIIYVVWCCELLVLYPCVWVLLLEGFPGVSRGLTIRGGVLR